MSLKLNRANSTGSVTIAVGATTSNEIVLDGYAMGMVHLPAEWEGTTLTFMVSPTKSGTYVALEDSAGNAVSLTVEASKAYALPEALFGAPYAKLVAGSTQTTTDTVIPVTLRG